MIQFIVASHINCIVSLYYNSAGNLFIASAHVLPKGLIHQIHKGSSLLGGHKAVAMIHPLIIIALHIIMTALTLD